MEKKVNIKTVLVLAGAFISFTIGAGFASGNEVLQFFGSWGFPKSLIAVVLAMIVTAVYTIGLYRAGQYVQFEKASDCYNFFGGKGLGTFFKIYVYFNLSVVYVTMFTGAGSLLNQQWGWSKWVGAIVMGVLAVVVVIGGFKTVSNVLGYAGILILAYTLVFGVVSLINPTSTFENASMADEMVAEGQIWQANILALPPLSYIPGLASLNSAWLEGILYGAVCIVSGFPFMIALGKRTKNALEATTAGIATSVGFYACVGFVLIILLTNFTSLINPETGIMFDFPTAAAVSALWPAGGWTYVVIIFIGIFTTVTGYLWVLQDLIFHNEEKSLKSIAFTVAITLVGIFLAGIIPFSAIVNFVWPISGFVGLIMTIAVLIRNIRGFDNVEGYTVAKAEDAEETN